MTHSVLVCHLCHLSIINRITNCIKEINSNLVDRLVFVDPKDALGAQYPIVFVVIDLESAACNLTRLVDAATRATTSLVLLWNKTRQLPLGKS
jgi:hypothetical protein